MKINLKHKMKAEVSLVDRTDRLGTVTVTAVKTEKPCQQLCHRELVGAHHMKYKYNYDHTQGNNSRI